MKTKLSLLSALLIVFAAHAQTGQATDQPLKIRHAEPLYMDLVRDLGARKGEKEWNIGAEISPDKYYTSHSSFIEYEFAPVNRLGFELEFPFSFYRIHSTEGSADQLPRNRMEGVKLASQYTFLVSAKHQLSAAASYTHEFMLHSFYTMSTKQQLLKAHRYSPALVVAKRWGQHFHSMIYTGPQWVQDITSGHLNFEYQLNTSVHYILPGSRHFVGVEMNQQLGNNTNNLVIRPQTKVVLSNTIALGIVTGIPVTGGQEGISFMMRLIYEPAAKK